MEGTESLIMRNDTGNVDTAGEMTRTLNFSPEGITEVGNTNTSSFQKLSLLVFCKVANTNTSYFQKFKFNLFLADPLHGEARCEL